MSKKPLRYFSFNILFSALLFFCSSALFTGCVTKVAPPPMYRDMSLSLDEVIRIAGRDIKTLKAVTGINIEENNKSYSYVDASLLLKKPAWLSMRIYKFGMLTGSFLVKDNVVHLASGKGINKFKEIGKELYYSIFWWEGLENAMMYEQGTEYVIKTENKEIRLDKSTLIPESQVITINNKKIYILYEEPKNYAVTSVQSPETEHSEQADFWHPSVLKIEIGPYRFTVKVEKLFVNPQLGENEFMAPGEVKNVISY
ncbi:MAG: hypothetical protein L0922_04255 [Candidatus Mariimomonas ferrooxydans]